jgi:hypothetical protein
MKHKEEVNEDTGGHRFRILNNSAPFSFKLKDFPFFLYIYKRENYYWIISFA